MILLPPQKHYRGAWVQVHSHTLKCHHCPWLRTSNGSMLHTYKAYVCCELKNTNNTDQNKTSNRCPPLHHRRRGNDSDSCYQSLLSGDKSDRLNGKNIAWGHVFKIIIIVIYLRSFIALPNVRYFIQIFIIKIYSMLRPI